MWSRDLPGAYPGSYTGRGYNEWEEVSPGGQYVAAASQAAATAAILTPRMSFVDNLPAFPFGNIGLGLIGLTLALVVLKRAL